MEKSSQRGRPVDPDLEFRVFAHALHVYAETGWVGFTIDAVAARAKVGKAAIYRRWDTKADMLVEALNWAPTSVHHPPVPEDDIWDYFEALVGNLIRSFAGPYGFAMLRAQVEALMFQELLGTAMDRRRRSWIESGRSTIIAAIERGQLPESVSPGLLHDVALGAVISHILSTPQARLAEWFNDPGDFPRRLTQLILKGADARPKDAPARRTRKR